MKKIILLFVIVTLSKINAQTPVTFLIKPNAAQGKDAIVWGNMPNNNYGNVTDIWAVSWVNNGNSIQRSFIEFDLSTIPANAVVTDARLNLYRNPNSINNGGFHSGQHTFNIARLTQSWAENTVTFNNQPNATTVGQVTVPSGNNSQNYTNIDVTSLVVHAKNNPALYFGWRIQLQTETPNRALVCASSDHPNSSLHPSLEITYIIPCPNLNANYTYTVNDNFVTFNNTSVGNGTMTYSWNFGNGTTSTQQNPSVFYTGGVGTYNVCLSTTDTCGTKTECKTINITCPSNQPDFSKTINGTTVSFNNNSTGYGTKTYFWNFGNGLTSTLENPIITYAQEGNYYACLTVSDTCVTRTFCDSVIINCSNSVASFNYTFNSATSVSFINNSTSLGNASYLWNFGNGVISTQTSPTIVFNTVGKYTVCLTMTDQCTQRVVCDTILICNPLNGSFTTQQPVGTTVEFTPVTNWGTSYIWDFGDGNMSIFPAPTYTYANTGNYLVCLNITDTCSSTENCQQVLVSLANVDKFGLKNFKVFPNPFESQIRITTDEPITTFRLLDVNGKVILTRQDLWLTEETLDLSGLSKGVYILEAFGKESRSVSRLVK